MLVYLNPYGHNWGKYKLDGYGVGYIVFAVIYTILFYAACGYVWSHRNLPVIKMRKIGLALLSVVILHVYLFMVLMVYPMNGVFPCSAEFWIMSIYLPIGIGLFQAQNQQLLLVSRDQSRILYTDHYKPLYQGYGRGIGGPKYWFWRVKLWWQGTSTQGKYEGFVLIGMVVQFLVSLTIYCISRRFTDSGIVSHRTSPAMCRRGWEWAPSIVWQLLWNYFFGPYLLWNIRMIHDIYQWRLQTTLAIIAGLPGTLFWLAAVYTDSFDSINKYWVPAMWLAPGLFVMELTTLIFPIIQIIKHKKGVRETQEALAAFDAKQIQLRPTATSSLVTRSTRSMNSKRGKMFTMESLEECLNSNFDGLQIYASCMELNGENIVFLTKVLQFQKQWHTTMSRTHRFSSAFRTMFRVALGIYIQLIHTDTASYPINIESPIYAKLELIFGPATALVASTRRSSNTPSPMSAVTPWDSKTPNEPPDSAADEFPLHAMPTRPASRTNESSEHILKASEIYGLDDPLANFVVPDNFDDHVFDAAFNSIKYMVWTETWQRYMSWKRSSTCAPV